MIKRWINQICCVFRSVLCWFPLFNYQSVQCLIHNVLSQWIWPGRRVIYIIRVVTLWLPTDKYSLIFTDLNKNHIVDYDKLSIPSIFADENQWTLQQIKFLMSLNICPMSWLCLSNWWNIFKCKWKIVEIFHHSFSLPLIHT